MNALYRKKLRTLILKEIKNMVDEEKLLSLPDLPDDQQARFNHGPLNPNSRTPHNLSTVKRSDSYDNFGGGKTGTCEQCGGMTYEGNCMESSCGSMQEYVFEGKMCEQCGGSMYEGECMECGFTGEMLNEGDCGCGTCAGCSDDGSDYSIDSMLSRHPLGDYSNLNNTNITPNQAFSAGYEVSDFDDEVYGLGATSMHIDFPQHGEVHKHKHNNYMAKPSLYKVAKYSQKLLQMIPDGYELDDWQRTKIAQISDDISEVYHSLDYDFYDDEC